MKRTVLVTGSRIGSTGFAIAERFAKEGYGVIVTAQDAQKAEEAAKEITEKYNVFSKGYQLDLRDEDRVIEIFKDADTLDVFVETLCLNAADLDLAKDVAAGSDFFGVTKEHFRRVLEANVLGNYTLVREAALRMRTHGKGAIVFLSSNSAVRPNPNRVVYITSKGGINSMSRALAVDLGPYGIRSNVIMPGTIKTSRWVAMGDKQISNGSMTPIGDISDFEDIANAAWFLGSDESKNITGTEITVDGGISCQIYPELLTRYRRQEIENKTAGK